MTLVTNLRRVSGRGCRASKLGLLVFFFFSVAGEGKKGGGYESHAAVSATVAASRDF